MDYDSKTEEPILFLKQYKKKALGNSWRNSSRKIYKGVNSSKKNIGLTSFKGEVPTKQEVEIAKNYILNRMVTAYLEITEILAMNQTPMYTQTKLVYGIIQTRTLFVLCLSWLNSKNSEYISSSQVE